MHPRGERVEERAQSMKNTHPPKRPTLFINDQVHAQLRGGDAGGSGRCSVLQVKGSGRCRRGGGDTWEHTGHGHGGTRWGSASVPQGGHHVQALCWVQPGELCAARPGVPRHAAGFQRHHHPAGHARHVPPCVPWVRRSRERFHHVQLQRTLTKKSGKLFRVGIFLDFDRLTTRTPHGAYVRGARRNRIDPHGGEIERLPTDPVRPRTPPPTMNGSASALAYSGPCTR